MGFKDFKEKIKTYWIKNMEGNYKAISKAMGAMLIAIVMGLSAPLTALALGDEANWGMFYSQMIGALSTFAVFFLSVFFGKNKTDEKK